jgi:hypothetical protein
MRRVAVWLTVMTLVSVVFFANITFRPLYQGIADGFDEKLNFTTARGNRTYEAIQNNTSIQLSSMLVFCTLALIFWGLWSMQQDEQIYYQQGGGYYP